MNEVIFLLNQLYSIYEVPICLFKDEKCLFNSCDIYDDVNPLLVDRNLCMGLLSNWDGRPFLELEDMHILYGVCQDINGLSCIIGPIAINSLSSAELYQYKNMHGMLTYNEFKIQNGNIVRTAAVLSILHDKINQEQIDPKLIIEQFYAKDNNNKVTEKDRFQHQFYKTELNLGHSSYHTEKLIMTALSNGDLDTLNTFTKTNIIEHIGLLSNYKPKQMEYIAIIGITLFTRAAMEGGTNPEEAYSIADLYIQKISHCKDILDMQKIIINARVDLCESVQRAKAKRHGLKYIEQCKQFIAKNLHHPITLDNLANEIGMNKCYLTHQFTQQEGKSLSKYIKEERITAAQNMLKYSNFSITEIANYLCFVSQSHFGKIFKSITGKTPNLYRTENTTVDFNNRVEGR